MVNMPALVGTAAYSCKARPVRADMRADMRLSIAVEHPGNLLLTVTEFLEYRRPLFNCEILIIANCEVSHNSQLLETQ